MKSQKNGADISALFSCPFRLSSFLKYSGGLGAGPQSSLCLGAGPQFNLSPGELS
ncbi:hypothetical protein PhaeoP75_01407 [Phaeobacter gallaeciensis]|uniref:Uncharacterized protein n=1 Tax=Phaeobacter gallaeciensis TaxID=60890 RepID=A0AAD0ECL2_9RHOB|nr:hypothetical protein Gal_01366 [Phaeobacter gallaeciensis DSM 26640]ATE92391.1 hypothetical protein PhaeoP11_01357 [Phaeobacter gallaeciensis]ATF01056.1 hypothetical protein PhaeoP75_01407 [Phaeobacter gallaeciensis]ATF05436.1 hypothetical protein PhaeoP63_01355 [Phaeobacter gallaeciensis]